jgi:hypothetical protein
LIPLCHGQESEEHPGRSGVHEAQNVRNELDRKDLEHRVFVNYHCTNVASLGRSTNAVIKTQPPHPPHNSARFARAQHPRLTRHTLASPASPTDTSRHTLSRHVHHASQKDVECSAPRVATVLHGQTTIASVVLAALKVCIAPRMWCLAVDHALVTYL